MFINNLKTILLFFIFAFFIAACGEDTESTSDDADEEIIDGEEVVEEVSKGPPIICLWSALSLRDAPNPKGKRVTTIYLGEKAKFLGETAVDSSNKSKPKEYAKIKLSDGKIGWVETRFTAIDAEAYAFKESSKLYKRPDILSAGKNEFEKMQYVVVLEEQDEWVKVKGIEKSVNWYREGWVKKDHLTDDETDIFVAILVQRALGKGDKEKKLEALNEILENSDLSSSTFSSDVRAMVDELTMPVEEEVIEETYDEDYGK